MYNRRDFLKSSGALLSSLALTPALGSILEGAHERRIGLQLYTLFSVIDQDVKGTLQKVADIGYKELESAFSKLPGYYGMKPAEFKTMVNGMGMQWLSHHVLGAPFHMPPGAKMPTGPDGKPIVIPPMRNLRDNMQELVDEAAEGGLQYMVCATTPIDSLDAINSSIDVLNKTGEACKKAHVQLCYHNHYHEFEAVEGKIPYDLLLSGCDKNLVKMELDLCWATKGGADPVALFNAHPGRFPLWHVKDIDATKEKVMPVGSGTIDFKRIFAAAKKSGMKHFFVEHDMPEDPFGSITSSYNYLKGIV